VRVGVYEFVPLDFRFQISGFGFRVSGLEFRISGFGFRVSNFRFRVSGFGIRVSGLGFWGPNLPCSQLRPRRLQRTPPHLPPPPSGELPPGIAPSTGGGSAGGWGGGVAHGLRAGVRLRGRNVSLLLKSPHTAHDALRIRRARQENKKGSRPSCKGCPGSSAHPWFISYHIIGIWGTGSNDVGLIQSTKVPRRHRDL